MAANFFMVPNSLIDRKDLSLHAKLTYCFLARLSDSNGRSFPSIPTIAAAIGLSPESTRTVRKCINDLINAGYLSTESRPHKSTIYKLIGLQYGRAPQHPGGGSPAPTPRAPQHPGGGSPAPTPRAPQHPPPGLPSPTNKTYLTRPTEQDLPNKRKKNQNPAQKFSPKIEEEDPEAVAEAKKKIAAITGKSEGLFKTMPR